MADRDLDLNDDERRLLERLPRESPLDPALEEQIADTLRREGLLRRANRWTLRVAQLAAAIVLLAGGAAAGYYTGRRNSLEAMLDRDRMPMSERILLLQRAGSAYVRAAQEYAAAAAAIDSTAIEVASQVLVGAAQAVARTDLDGGLTPRLVSVLRTANTPPATETRQVIWY
jgi:hypothetical protein